MWTKATFKDGMVSVFGVRQPLQSHSDNCSQPTKWKSIKKFTCEVFTYVFHITGQNVKVSSAIVLTLLQIYSEIVNYFQVSELIPATVYFINKHLTFAENVRLLL